MEQTVSKKEFKGFSGNELKVFAIIAMLMDHLASTIWPGYHKDWWLLAIHLFGRLAAPTMWFMIAEGYQYTRNFKKYLARLSVPGLGAEPDQCNLAAFPGSSRTLYF